MAFEFADSELFNKVCDWNPTKQVMKDDLTRAKTWTEEEFRAFHIPEARIQAFMKNIEICGLSAKERNKADLIPAFIEASKRVAIYHDALFFKIGNQWRNDLKARKKVLYDAIGDTSQMARFIDFIECDERSEHKTFETMNLTCIPVGTGFFDFSNGVMIEGAEEELWTYSLPECDYHSMTLEECTSKLMTDLIKHMGKGNLDYLMKVVADSMIGLHIADRRACFITGAPRTGKGTFGQVLKYLGLAPRKELTHDFKRNNNFMDSYAEVSSVYPVIFVDEAESLNMEKVKKICSDETMQCDIKGEPAITAINRGVPMFTSNKSPRCSIEGIYEKMAFIKTSGIQFEKDNNYFDQLTADDYNEFMCVLLTYCTGLYNYPTHWNNSKFTTEMQEIHTQFIDANFAHDSFFIHTERDGGWNETANAYHAYLTYCNPDVEEKWIDNIVASSELTPNKKPEGVTGKSRTEFISVCRTMLEVRRVNGKTQIKGTFPTKN